SRWQGRRVRGRPLLVAGRDRAGYRANPREPRCRRDGPQGAATVRALRPRMACRSFRRHASAETCPDELGAGRVSAGIEDNEHLKIVAVIQARMGSTRLPGKVLKPIAGKPLLWHIIHRLRTSHLIEEIAIATTVNPLDDAIVDFAEREGIAVVRGPED